MRLMNLVCSGLSLMLVVTTTVSAAGPARREAARRETKKGGPDPVASANFGKELGLGVPSLNTLGARIEAARDAGDPVGLAAVAKELSVLEKVSGKTGSVKSEDLAKEAAEMAHHRDDATELKAVAMLLSDHPAAQKLTEQAEKAEKREATEKAEKEKGGEEKSRGIRGTLHVDNRTAEAVRIFIDGRDVGVVGPIGDGVIFIGQGAYETTTLDARGSAGGAWHDAIAIPVGDFTWVLTN